MKKLSLVVLVLLSLTLCIVRSHTIPEYFGVDFYTSMGNDANNTRWKKAKSLYDKYIVTNLTYSEVPRIPKIIHQIWLGRNPFPAKCREFQKTWIDNHPDWEYKLWTDEDIEELELYNHERYHATKNVGEKADIARYEILYRFGGLYVDTDFECLKPFDIFHHCCDFYAGCCSGSTLAFIGLIGTIPNHPILKSCIANLHTTTTKKATTSMEVLINTGPYLFTNCVFQELTNCDAPWIIFPPTYFYPWPHFERDNNKPEQIRKWIKPETFAIHHWSVSWNKGKSPSNNKLD